MILMRLEHLHGGQDLPENAPNHSLVHGGTDFISKGITNISCLLTCIACCA